MQFVELFIGVTDVVNGYHSITTCHRLYRTFPILNMYEDVGTKFKTV